MVPQQIENINKNIEIIIKIISDSGIEEYNTENKNSLGHSSACLARQKEKKKKLSTLENM